MNNGKAVQTKKKGAVCMAALLTSYFMTAVMLLILICVSAVSGRILLQQGLHLFTTMILCAGSGMMGGMLS